MCHETLHVWVAYVLALNTNILRRVPEYFIQLISAFCQFKQSIKLLYFVCQQCLYQVSVRVFYRYHGGIQSSRCLALGYTIYMLFRSIIIQGDRAFRMSCDLQHHLLQSGAMFGEHVCILCNFYNLLTSFLCLVGNR